MVKLMGENPNVDFKLWWQGLKFYTTSYCMRLINRTNQGGNKMKKEI
jgi:hypothetical protein